MENKITVKELLKRRPDCKSFVEELVSDALASEDGILFRMAGGWSNLNPEEEWMEIENELYPKFLDEFLKWSADIPVRMGDDENLSYQLENIMDDFVEEVEDKYGDMAQDMIDKALKDIDESRRPHGRMLKEESEDYYTYTIPEWTLPYIFNDDPSGLEDDEIEAVDNFVASLPKGWVIDVDEDEDGNTQTFFSHTNDLPGKHGKLGNTCVDVKVTVF